VVGEYGVMVALAAVAGTDVHGRGDEPGNPMERPVLRGGGDVVCGDGVEPGVDGDADLRA
jgi:hypothetical protein